MLVPLDVNGAASGRQYQSPCWCQIIPKSGGLNQGVSLRMPGKPILAEWKRSVFNGLAQIIVQSTREPGAIKLTATAEGLSPATVSVQSQPCRRDGGAVENPGGLKAHATHSCCWLSVNSWWPNGFPATEPPKRIPVRNRPRMGTDERLEFRLQAARATHESRTA